MYSEWKVLQLARREAPVWVYAIQAGTDGPIKIGTTKDPRQRLLTLQTANAEELQPLALWRGWLVEERDLHTQFAECRLQGEWFKPSPDLLAMLRYLDGACSCEWHNPTSCLAAVPSGWPGTCKACGFEFEEEKAA